MNPVLSLSLLLGFIPGPAGPNAHQAALDTPVVVVDVAGSRPLALALMEIQAKTGLVITYEDPGYFNEYDILDVTREVTRTVSARAVRVPRGGTFVVWLSESDVASIDGLMGRVLEAYASAGLPGTFRHSRRHAAVHVFPVATRGVDGTSVPYSSPLDARISIAPAERTLVDHAEAILAAASTASRRELGLATAPQGGLSMFRTTLGFADEPARDALARVLALTDTPLSWQLLCSPPPETDCALNVFVVRTRRP